MGGKRPDQHNLDPGEGGATDYKNLPQTGRGHSNLDDTVSRDRQKYAENRQEAAGGSGAPAPGSRPAPSTHAREGRPADAEGSEGFDEGREREALGNSEFDGDEVGA